MKDQLSIAAIALLFLTATNSHAGCTSDDIRYYLSEGFTQEQITAICTVAKEPVAPSNTAAMPEPESSSNTDAERYLLEAIDGQDVHVEGGFLHYTAKVCIPYGQFNDNKEPWLKEACELVRHKVSLRGMRAKREWFSLKLSEPRQIYLEGQIEREIVGDLDDFSSISRRQIIQNLRTEVKATVPIKENMSPDRLLESLNKTATRYGELDE